MCGQNTTLKYHIITFGCQMNENDSQQIASLLFHAHYQPCDSVEDADIIIINTCCVRQSAENKIYGLIGRLKKIKQESPQKIVIVFGCMAQKEGTAAKINDQYKHVDMILGTFALAKIPHYIETFLSDRKKIVDIKEEKHHEEPLRTPEANIGYKSQVNIIHGCNNFCTYCIVPYVRGREMSRTPESILKEIDYLAGHGVSEIQLLGQNVNSYAKDFTADSPNYGWDFARLLQEVAKIDPIKRIRYMTSHPRDFSKHLVDVIGSLDKVCKHFHLPAQSGCNEILKKMNRGYTTEYYYDLLSYIRKACPNATITTDFIVGFPGETDKNFQETLQFVEKCRFDAAYTFLYSNRSGTPAAKMEQQVASEIKKERLQQLMNLQNPISLACNEHLVGQTMDIMVEGESKTNSAMWSGRSGGNKIVIFEKRTDLKEGQIIPVKITASKTWNLIGALV